MSVWTDPKTDWNGANNEYFNIVPDYQRIKGNIEYLGDFASLFGFNKNRLYEMEEVNLKSVPKASFFNNLVYNIDMIKSFLQYLDGYQNMRTYVAKGKIWNYYDLNIIERNIGIIKDELDGMYNSKDKLPFIQLGLGDEL